MGASVAARRTRILVMTSEVELIALGPIRPGAERLPGQLGRAFRGGRQGAIGPFDIVVLDLSGASISTNCAMPNAPTRTRTSSSYAAAIARRTASPFWIWMRTISLVPSARRIWRRGCASPNCGASTRACVGAIYRHGSFVIDLFNRTVAMEGERIALAPSEMSVLTLLASRAGHVATFGRILAGLGRADSASGRRALRASVFRLRRKIERDPRRPDLLLDRGRGWLSPCERDGG